MNREALMRVLQSRRHLKGLTMRIQMTNKEFLPPWDLFQPLNTDAFVVILEGFNRGFHRGSFAS